MKPALFWTLKRDFYDRYELMAVTSEKEGSRGRYFGRDVYGNATHCRRGETYGRFEDPDTARRATEGIRNIRENYQRRIAEYRRLEREQVAERDAAIATYLKTFRPQTTAPADTEAGTGRAVPPHGTAERYAMDAEVD